jgi:RNase adapter protein RapZ
MNDKIVLFLVTGVAGAGKTTFASVCEEKGYHVIEDFPTSMIPSLLDVFKREPEVYDKVALFVNISKVEESSRAVKSDPAFAVTTVGLDCSTDVLLTRFRLTRHIHPLQPKGYSLSEALAADAEKMAETHPLYDIYIDTTGLTEKDLRKKASALLEKSAPKLHIIISSFGYKYGLPKDAEIVIDARGLINPYWVKSLSRMTGLDQPVIDYIEKDPHTQEFMGKLFSLLDDYLTHSAEEGRSFIVLDVGCSGGQHRSVYVAEKIFSHYKNTYACTLYHRELSRYLEDEKD